MKKKIEGKISAKKQKQLELYNQGVSIQKMAEEMKLGRNTYRSTVVS